MNITMKHSWYHSPNLEECDELTVDVLWLGVSISGGRASDDYWACGKSDGVE
jgi:hypothetical protein